MPVQRAWVIASGRPYLVGLFAEKLFSQVLSQVRHYFVRNFDALLFQSRFDLHKFHFDLAHLSLPVFCPAFQFSHEEMQQKVRERGRPEPTLQNYADAAAVGERIREAIEKIITLDGLECEACGLWVWVRGQEAAFQHTL